MNVEKRGPSRAELGEMSERDEAQFPAETGESLPHMQYERGRMNPEDGTSRAEDLEALNATLKTEENTRGTEENTEQILSLLKSEAETETGPEHRVERQEAA